MADTSPKHLDPPQALGASSCAACRPACISGLAIDIVLDGEQIAATCPDCDRLVRPFGWHRDDGLPNAYLARIDHSGRAIEAAAWYWSPGLVRSVPAVDPERPWRYRWQKSYSSSELARGILAHLVGLDLPDSAWEAFDFDVVLPLVLRSEDDLILPLTVITEWLVRNQ